jgi:hypothetical protein
MHAVNYSKTDIQSRRTTDDVAATAVNFRNVAKEFLLDALAATGRARKSAGMAIRFLDLMFPLSGASHADVDTYGVDIPLRYASFFALLSDGRKIRLQDPRNFAGWSGWVGKRSFLLCNGGRYVEILTNPAKARGGRTPGHVRDLIIESDVTSTGDTGGELARNSAWLSLLTGAPEAGMKRPSRRVRARRKFIAPDGSQLVLPG